MVNKTVETRNGLKFQFSVPASIDEYTKAANRGQDAVLDDALDTNIYRSGLPDAWDQLATTLAKEYSIKKIQKPHPNKDKAAKGETVDAETDPAYVDRVISEKVTDGTFPTEIDAIKHVQGIVDSMGVIELDLTERRGKGGGNLVGKGDLEMALTYIDAGPEKCNAALNKIAKLIGEPAVQLTGNRDEDQKAVALAIKAYRSAAAKSLIG